MMKWEKYNKLTVAQKEEYNYRFKDITYPHLSFIWVVVLWVAMVGYSAIGLVILKEYIDVSLTFINLMGSLGKVTSAFVIVFLFDYIGQFGYFIWQKVKEGKWLKKSLSKQQGGN